VIKIYYLKEECLPALLGSLFSNNAPEAGNYVYVRHLDEDDLEKAWEAMQGTDENLPRDDAGKAVRSMMIGDVIIKGKRGFQVAPVGFKEFDPVAAGFVGKKGDVL